MAQNKLRLSISIFILLFTMSCKKEGNPTTQELLDKGESIETILSMKPADSLIGKTYLGGFIFYVDDQNSTGMIVSSEDVTASTTWGCNSSNISGTDSAAVGYGAQNTSLIVQACTDQFGAAYQCDNYVDPNGFTDWYLPSEQELYLVYQKLYLKGLGAFEDDYYWSSTQSDFSAASAQHVLFIDGSISYSSKANTHRVRAVKNF